MTRSFGRSSIVQDCLNSNHHFTKNMSLKFINSRSARGFALSAILIPMGLLAHDSTETQIFREVINLKPYTVTGAWVPGDDATVLPVSSLYGESLDTLRTGTLGDTLEALPGIQSTAFAAGASRPVIRGFDGPRVQILQEGMPLADVSADSPDHAVNITPDFAESIDVIRGSATLLYGGSAVGGVINVVGSLFPSLQLESGSTSQLSSAYHTVNRGWSHQLETQVNQGDWAVRASVSNQAFEDYDIPGYAASEAERNAFHHEDEHDHDHEHEDEHEDEHEHENEALEKDRLGSSFSDALQASVGIRYRINNTWSVAAALGTQERLYGVPGHTHAHEEGEDHEYEDEHEEHEDEHDHEHGSVQIDMDMWHADFELSGRWDEGWLRALKWRTHHSNYEHQEMEGDAIATNFDKTLWSHRIELSHVFTDELSGVLGAQLDRVNSDVVGEEALTPSLKTWNLAFFSAQRWQRGSLGLHAGARMERMHTDVSAGLPDYEESVWSGAIGMDWNVSERSKLDLVISRSARHPTGIELYADGMHVATRSYEIGDVNLRQEVAQGVDLRFEYQQKRWHVIASSFFNRFDNYLFAAPTGDTEHGFPVYQYQNADADFWGVEGELCWKVNTQPDHRLEISLVGDLVKANLLDSTSRLPRVPASRLGLVVFYQHSDWTLRSDFRHVFAVSEVADNELPSEAYRVWNLYLSRSIPISAGSLTVQLRLRNLLDEEIRPHTSFLKDLAPQPGRGAEIALRWQF